MKSLFFTLASMETTMYKRIVLQTLTASQSSWPQRMYASFELQCGWSHFAIENVKPKNHKKIWLSLRNTLNVRSVLLAFGKSRLSVDNLKKPSVVSSIFETTETEKTPPLPSGIPPKPLPTPKINDASSSNRAA